MGCVTSHHDEALGIFLEALGTLEEKHKVLEDPLRNLVVALEEVLHVLTEQNWVLLIDTNLD